MVDGTVRMEKAWFEMRDVIRRRIADAAWVPLAISDENRIGDYGHVGYRRAYRGAHSVAVLLAHRAEGEKVSWSDHFDVGVWVQDGVYKPAEVLPLHYSDAAGVALALRQHFDGAVPATLHLNQDLVVALRLWREGDLWLRPCEGYAEVARLRRDEQGHEVGIEIRSEYLRDYLAARSMALRLCTYQSRTAVLEDVTAIGWSDEPTTEDVHGGRFEGRASAIHEGGFAFGAETAVFHSARTDVDVEAEIPVMEPAGEDGVATRSWTFKRKGRKVFRVEGEFWRDEWIEPAALSPRVKGDHVPSDTTFVISGAGNRVSADVLNHEDIGKWLWFRPEVVNTVLAHRGARLGWHTRETGRLEMSAGGAVHFGLNERGLVNAYAYDVARLNEWERRIWAGFNVAPDGGVSAELTASQVHAAPASTQAAEAFLAKGLEALNDAFRERFGQALIPDHPEHAQIIARTHRFRATDFAGLLALAKDLARLTADSCEPSALKAVLNLKKDDRTGTLKGLQAVLALIISEDRARELVGPLVGVYELRLGDAHLPSSKLEAALTLANVNRSVAFVHQGRDMIEQVVSILFTAAAVLAGEAVTPEQRAQGRGD